MPDSTPAGWQRVRLGEVAEIGTGGTPPREHDEYWQGNVPWMASGEIHQRRVRATAECITTLGLKNSNAKVYPVGTVMVAMNGQGRTRGMTALLDIEAACNQSLAAIRSDGRAEQRFLFHVLDQSYERLRNLTGDGRSGLNLELIRAFDLLLPPLPEQRAIAAVLDAVDDTIERTEAVIAATEELRRALLHELLTHGVPGWHSEWKQVPGLGTVPACWEGTRVDEIADVVGGSTPPRQESRYFGGGIPWVTPTDITRLGSRDLDATTETLTQEGQRVAGLRLLPAGSVLVTSRATIGAMAIARVPVTTNQGFQNLIPHEGIDSNWLYYSMLRRKPELDSLASGSTFREFSRDSLRSLRIAVPTPSEQVEIGRACDLIETRLARENASRAGSSALKAALADALLSGRVRIADMPRA